MATMGFHHSALALLLAQTGVFSPTWSIGYSNAGHMFFYPCPNLSCLTLLQHWKASIPTQKVPHHCLAVHLIAGTRPAFTSCSQSHKCALQYGCSTQRLCRKHQCWDDFGLGIFTSHTQYCINTLNSVTFLG